MTDARPLTLAVKTHALPLADPFQISGHVFTDSKVVVVTLGDGKHVGRGEASGVYYLNDDVAAMVAAIEAARPVIEAGVTREQLRGVMPAGGGRNAIDCALWELEARRRDRPVWELAGLDAAPRPIVTTFTLSAEEPEAMVARAKSYAGRYGELRALKLKLTGELALDCERVRQVRAANPDIWIGVDANQGFEIGELPELLETLLAADVQLLEQPIARGHESQLVRFESPIPVAADESALTLADLPGLVGRFDVVNIKLDKCGGLTEGLAMARAARALGLQVMVGNMVGTGLAMAPAFILGQLCDIVDLDGPIFLADDPAPTIVYEAGTAFCSEAVWGRAAAA